MACFLFMEGSSFLRSFTCLLFPALSGHVPPTTSCSVSCDGSLVEMAPPPPPPGSFYVPFTQLSIISKNLMDDFRLFGMIFPGGLPSQWQSTALRSLVPGTDPFNDQTLAAGKLIGRSRSLHITIFVPRDSSVSDCKPG